MAMLHVLDYNVKNPHLQEQICNFPKRLIIILLDRKGAHFCTFKIHSDGPAATVFFFCHNKWVVLDSM